jgi:hypothetical protein
MELLQGLCISFSNSILRVVLFCTIGVLLAVHPELIVTIPLQLGQRMEAVVRRRLKIKWQAEHYEHRVRIMEALHVPRSLLIVVRAIGFLALLAAAWRTVLTLLCL